MRLTLPENGRTLVVSVFIFMDEYWAKTYFCSLYYFVNTSILYLLIYIKQKSQTKSIILGNEAVLTHWSQSSILGEGNFDIN